MTGKRILFIAFLFAKNDNANSTRNRNTAIYLSKRGYKVDVIGFRKIKDSSFAQKLELNKINYYSVFDSLSLSKILNNIYYTITESIRILLNRRGYKDLYRGFFNGAFKTLIASLQNKNKYEYCLVGVLPWTLYELLPYIKKTMPIVLDVSDPLYKNAIYDPQLKGDLNALKREKAAFLCADKVIVMSEPLVAMYEKDFEIPPGHIQFVSPACNSFQEKTSDVIKRETRDTLNLLYAGSLYKGYRDIDILIETLKDKSEYYLEIITNYPIQEHAPNVACRQWVNRDTLEQMYATTDVLVFIDNFYGYQVPSKIFELLSTSRPILFIYDSRNLYLYELLKGEPFVFFAENTKESIANQLRKIKSLDKTISIKHQFQISQFSEEQVSQQILEILEECID